MVSILTWHGHGTQSLKLVITKARWLGVTHTIAPRYWVLLQLPLRRYVGCLIFGRLECALAPFRINTSKV